MHQPELFTPTFLQSALDSNDRELIDTDVVKAVVDSTWTTYRSLIKILTVKQLCNIVLMLINIYYIFANEPGQTGSDNPIIDQ
jgi:hypothetical protein